MWSDPIDNALAAVLDIIKGVQRGEVQPDAPQVAWAVGALDRAKDAREVEKREGRLITPQDPF